MSSLDEPISWLAAILFAGVWLAYYVFMEFQYRRDMKGHRRGSLLEGWFPKSQDSEERYGKALFLQLVSVGTDTLSLSTLAISVLEPRPSSSSDKPHHYPLWIQHVIWFCQSLMLRLDNPDVSEAIFVFLTVLGVFLLAHRLYVFRRHGVRVDPLNPGVGRRGWLGMGRLTHWTAEQTGLDYRSGCNGKVETCLLRNRILQTLFDFFILSIMQLLVSSGKCAGGGLVFDGRVHCGSFLQYLYLFAAAAAACGWYVWVTMQVLRMQNHYPLTAASGMGDRGAPQDVTCPFFLLLLFQVKIFLGGITALDPRANTVLLVTALAALCLLGRTLQFWPSRFRLVNVGRVLGSAFVLVLAIVAWAHHV